MISTKWEFNDVFLNSRDKDLLDKGMVLLYNLNMIEEIESVIGGLEQSSEAEEVSQVTGLSEADISAVRGTPLWWLREFIKEQSNNEPH